MGWRDTVKPIEDKSPSWRDTEVEDPESFMKSDEPSTLEKVLNVIDIPGSLARTGVEAAFSPDREVIPSLQEQVIKTVKSPTTAADEAPSGAQVNKSIFPEYDEESLPGIVGSFTTEMALDPLSWFRPSKVPAKKVRKSLESVSERQAAKAISKYANKTDVLKEGADLDVIGSRLVQEDLQGQLRNPVKLYETLSGKKHLQKLNPGTLETLQIKKGLKEEGLIGKTSKEITGAIDKVEKEYGLAPQIPANIMTKRLLESAKKNLSQVSGETVNLDKIQDILERTLKPYAGSTTIPGLPGAFPEETITDLASMSLTNLHELRKNIGKQVADRAFYAAADVNMREETEVLRDLYRELGSVIEKSLEGKELIVGNTKVDAAKYYKAQNNKLKSFLDLQSMLEYQPTEALKDADIAAKVSSMVARGTVGGAAGVGASMMGVPVNPVSLGLFGAGIGAASSAADFVKSSTPEYLSSIFKTAGKAVEVPFAPEAATRGTIQFMRDGKFQGQNPSIDGYDFKNVRPAFPLDSNPQEVIRKLPGSTFIDKKQLIKFKLPRTTEGLLSNKEMVLAKLAQVGVDPETYGTISHALNNEPERVADIAPLVMTQFPQLFESSKYKVFDGYIVDPADRGRMADEISKREDLDSIKKAKAISRINKTGMAPEGIA